MNEIAEVVKETPEVSSLFIMDLNLNTIREQMFKENQAEQVCNISIFNGTPRISLKNFSPLNQEAASFSL